MKDLNSFLDAKIKGQGHKIENAHSAIFKSVVYEFLCYFSTNVCETWLVYRQYLVH